MILDKINWKNLSEEAKKQQRNREVHSPTISLFRWWARRSHAVFGSLLDAAVMEFERSFLVSDPFSGGGTVAVEADRRGLKVYAQDIQPWVVLGLQVTLDRVSSAELKVAGKRLLERMTQTRLDNYGTACPVHGPNSEVIHTYWVKTVHCPSCRDRLFLFPHNLLTYSHRVERKIDDQTAYFGCAFCGEVSLGPRKHSTQVCPACGRHGTDSVVDGKSITCPRCDHSGTPGEFRVTDGAGWEPVLVQRLCTHGREKILHFDIPTYSERSQACVATELDVDDPLSDSIPRAKETRRLLEWGFTRWRDLYPGRQLAVYLEAAQQLSQMCDLSPQVRRRLLLALCGAPEMAGFSSRWDRFHLKAFEATANHRFSVSTFTVEVNPMGPRGRGTLPRRILHSVKAAEWSENYASTRDVKPAMVFVMSSSDNNPVRNQFPAVVLGSSEVQRLESGTVGLVLTDPPYYDDVQYGELALPFTAWARQLGLCPPSMIFDTSREAVANPARQASHYESLLTAIFSECRRTLTEDGRLVFTFHNTKLDGWVALGRSLRAAGFQVAALAVVHAENETDHSKRNKNSFSKDLVLECRIGTETGTPWTPAIETVGAETEATKTADTQTKATEAAGAEMVTSEAAAAETVATEAADAESVVSEVAEAESWATEAADAAKSAEDERVDETTELLAMGRALAGSVVCDRTHIWDQFCSLLPAGKKTRIR